MRETEKYQEERAKNDSSIEWHLKTGSWEVKHLGFIQCLYFSLLQYEQKALLRNEILNNNWFELTFIILFIFQWFVRTLDCIYIHAFEIVWELSES